jgi:hypothetical protein
MFSSARLEESGLSLRLESRMAGLALFFYRGFEMLSRLLVILGAEVLRLLYMLII